MPSSPSVEQPAATAHAAARRARFAARSALRTFTDLPRVGACGIPMGSHVDVRAARGAQGTYRASYAGLETCGSTWCCPTCSLKIAEQRRQDLNVAMLSHRETRWQDGASDFFALDARGTSTETRGSFSLLTLTVQHDRPRDHADKVRRRLTLSDLWDDVLSAWEKFLGGRAWQAARARWGIVHYARVVEVTYGVSGWHVHLHVLLFTTSDLDRRVDLDTVGALVSFDALPGDCRAQAFPGHGLDRHGHQRCIRRGCQHGSIAQLRAGSTMLDTLRAWAFDRWATVVARVGPAHWRREVGPRVVSPLAQDLRAFRGDGAAEWAADYFTKATFEVTRGALKAARRGGVTPFGILGVLATGEIPEGVEVANVDQAHALWFEWESASKGRRQMGWSVGLRGYAGLCVVEATDEELAAASVDGVTVASVTRSAWFAAFHVAGHRAADLLALVERSLNSGAPLAALWSAVDDYGQGLGLDPGDVGAPHEVGPDSLAA